MPAIKHEVYVALEKSLADRLTAGWHKISGPYLRTIWKMVEEGDISRANAIARSINLDPVLRDNLPYIRYLTEAALVFGATRATEKAEDTEAAQGHRASDDAAESAVRLLIASVQRNAEDSIREKLVQLIAQTEIEQKYDPNQPRDPAGTSTGGQWSSSGTTTPIADKAIPKHIVDAVEAQTASIGRCNNKNDCKTITERLAKSHGEEIVRIIDGLPHDKREAVLVHKGDAAKGIPTVWALGWGKARGTDIHGHGASEVGVSVLRGSVVEHAYVPETPGEHLFEGSKKPGGMQIKVVTREFKAGESVALPAPYLHDVFGLSENNKDITLHAYFPPLKKMEYFQLDGRTLVYDGEWDEDKPETSNDGKVRKWDHPFRGPMCCATKFDPEQPRGYDGRWIPWNQPAMLKDSLGISRKDMPQIKWGHYKDLKHFVEDRGISWEKGKVSADQLKPAQSEYNPNKMRFVEKDKLDKPVIISADNYVLDGTHRWLYYLKHQPHKRVPIVRIGTNARAALALMHHFPHVGIKDVHGNTLKFDPDQPRDESGRWTRYHVLDKTYLEEAKQRGYLDPAKYKEGVIWTSRQPISEYEREFPGAKLVEDNQVEVAITSDSRIFKLPPGRTQDDTSDRVTDVRIPMSDVREVRKKYDPDQPRDEDGRWSPTSGWSPGEFVYHGTAASLVENILREGIKPGDRWMGRDPAVYAAISEEHALAYAVNRANRQWFQGPDRAHAVEGAVIKVRYDKNKFKPDTEEEKGKAVFTSATIDPKDIVAYRTYKARPYEILERKKGGVLEAFKEGASPWHTVSKADDPEYVYVFVFAIQKVRKFDPDQPRIPAGEPGGGQWSKEGGGAAFDKAKGLWVKDGKPMATADQARIKALRLPPAWTEVKLNPDTNGDLQAVGKDVKGRTQYLYSAAHTAKAAAEKFARLKEFNGKVPLIKDQSERDMKSGRTQEIRDTAAVLNLIAKTGFRIGSDADNKTKHHAFGASTLLGHHVKIDGDKLSFGFIGKKGVRINKTIHDEALANFLRSKAVKGERLFVTNESLVRDYLKNLAGPDFHVKDLRTWQGTAKAIERASKLKPPKNEKEYKKWRREIGKAVANHLGNTPAVALSAYIDPSVFKPYHEKWGVKKIDAFDKMLALMNDYFETTHFAEDRVILPWTLVVETGADPDDNDADEIYVRDEIEKWDPNQPRDELGRWTADQIARERYADEQLAMEVERRHKLGIPFSHDEQKLFYQSHYNRMIGVYDVVAEVRKYSEAQPRDERGRWTAMLNSFAKFFGVMPPRTFDKKLHNSDEDWAAAVLNNYGDVKIQYFKDGTAEAYDKLGRAIAFFDGWQGYAFAQKEEKVQKLAKIQDFVSFANAADDGAQANMRLLSGLHTSRMSAYGFLVEAKALGYKQYQISAQLDNRGCSVCEFMDGKVFDIDALEGSLDEIFAAKSPDDLAHIQEWPGQSKEDLNELYAMSDDDIVSNNWNLPPWHPGCRCLCVPVGTPELPENTPSYEAAQDEVQSAYEPPKSIEEVAEKDINKIANRLDGLEGPHALAVWEDLADEWGEDVLEELTGLTEKDILLGAPLNKKDFSYFS